MRARYGWAAGVLFAGVGLVAVGYGFCLAAFGVEYRDHWSEFVPPVLGPYEIAAVLCWLVPGWPTRSLAGVVLAIGVVMVALIVRAAWPALVYGEQGNGWVAIPVMLWMWVQYAVIGVAVVGSGVWRVARWLNRVW